ELAVCFPLLAMLLLGTVEACNMLFVAQSVKVVAYEGARIGVIPGAEADNLRYYCEQLLENRSIHGGEILISPADPEGAESGSYLTVTVEVPYGDNALVSGGVFGGQTVRRSASLLVQ
ncbi:MAG: TadE family protein, partial [Planctomycetota bacterium]